MSSPTRWAGVPLTDRRTERRALLVDAAFRCSATGARPPCRCARSAGSAAEHPLLLRELRRYRRAARRGATTGSARSSPRRSRPRSRRQAIRCGARTRAGIAAVLGFSSADPRRGRVLFTEARANPVLAGPSHGDAGAAAGGGPDRRRAAAFRSDPFATAVGAAVFTGAMAELAQQWLTGSLGGDLDVVVDDALAVRARTPVKFGDLSTGTERRAEFSRGEFSRAQSARRSSRPAPRRSAATPARAGRGPCRRRRRTARRR